MIRFLNLYDQASKIVDVIQLAAISKAFRDSGWSSNAMRRLFGRYAYQDEIPILSEPFLALFHQKGMLADRTFEINSDPEPEGDVRNHNRRGIVPFIPGHFGFFRVDTKRLFVASESTSGFANLTDEAWALNRQAVVKFTAWVERNWKRMVNATVAEAITNHIREHPDVFPRITDKNCRLLFCGTEFGNSGYYYPLEMPSYYAFDAEYGEMVVPILEELPTKLNDDDNPTYVVFHRPKK